MSHKNAYELRVDLLHLAYNIACVGLVSSDKVDPDEVVEIAKKLNAFVSSNDQKHTG